MGIRKNGHKKKEIGFQENWYLGKMDVGKNGNLEELNFGKTDFQKCKLEKMKIWKHANQEKYTLGKMHTWKNANFEVCKF